MTTAVSSQVEECADTTAWKTRTNRRIALFGLGHVGSAVARLAPTVSAHLGYSIRIAGALVRDATAARRTPTGFPLVTDARLLLDERPDAIVEALGGLEPARSLVLESIQRGIPVVTANKSLMAKHGEELFEAAGRCGVPLRYEACVIAGVPFLGAFARRPLAAAITRIAGILNGTSHFILSRIQAGATYAESLAEAQRLGFAEPDPSKDIDGSDAAEKLTILLHHFGGLRVSSTEIETSGIESITPEDLSQAAAFGGTIKPLACADWTERATPAVFVGPTLVLAGHPLAGLQGVTNGICLRGPLVGPLFFSGPGAGPDPTAATLLDDVTEALSERRERRDPRPSQRCHAQPARCCSWFVRLRSTVRLPDAVDVADLLASYGIWCRRTSPTIPRHGGDWRWLHTYPCAGSSLRSALDPLCRATTCDVWTIPVLEATDGK